MGTLTISMGSFEAQGAGWLSTPVRRTRKLKAEKAEALVSFAGPLVPAAGSDLVKVPSVDLPHLRDSRGTLLAPYQEGHVDRFSEESVAGDEWRGSAEAPAAAPVVDAAKAAELDALHRLVYACMRGDGAAWQQLVVSQHRRVYGICYRFTGSPTDAEDLTQDVFLKVYRNLAGFDPVKGAFTTWLTTLTRNLLVDHFRRTRQDRATDSLDESAREGEDGPTLADRLADTRPNQMHRVAQMELRSRIQHALKQLSPELREAVILRDLQDMDYREIAAVLRVPEGTVKSRISRGRAEMARMLGRTEGRVM
jgi:RNA polymerase sigma-70 factor (ECF subfamily)